MAQSEPMDVDNMDNDFDNKENTFQYNVPCTEKGYEELDVSELNMKLRFSMTPASSPMSKSYTTCPDSQYETGDTLNCNNLNANLTRSLNSSMGKNDNIIKSLKSLPLQSLGTEQFADGNNSLIYRQQVSENANITAIISGTSDIDENLSLPSSSSSALQTPEATTPTKEIKEEVSPIIRGLKSMLNMFRSSTSPVPQAEGENMTVKQEVLSPENTVSENYKQQTMASTPITTHITKDINSSKRSSPYKDSIVFNEDLEKELNWNGKSISNSEKMMIPKLLLQNSKTLESKAAEANLDNMNIKKESKVDEANLDNSTGNNFDSMIQYMDISNNESMIQDRTITKCPNSHGASFGVESDGEFLDCETTFSKNESYVLDIKGVQEKMSSKINLDETKGVLSSPKSAEFLDCNSTISNNESYVLDFKEIHEKISARLNLSQTKHMSITSENVPKANQTVDENATSMSFADLDLKFDTTMPEDYSDYSQATTEILTELDRLETSKIDRNKKKNINENITEQKDVTGKHLRTSECMIKKNTQDNNTLEQNDETTESQENQRNITTNMCDDLDTTLTEKESVKTSLSVEPKIIDDPETHGTVQFTDCPVKSENKTLKLQEDNVKVDNSNGGCKVNVENSSNTVNACQTLEATIVKVGCTPENIEPGTETKTKEYTKTPVEIFNNTVQTVLSEKSYVIQTDVIPVEVISSLQNDVLSEASNDKLSTVLQNSHEILPVDLPLEEENLLDVIQNINVIQTTDDQITESPSDIPLPADDFEEKSVTVNEVEITSVQKILACSSNTIITSKSAAIDTFPVAADAFAENKCSNDSVSTSVSVAQLSEHQTPENNVSDVKILKTLSEKQMNNTVTVLFELDHLSLKADNNPPDLSTSELSSAVNVSNETNPDNLLTNNITGNKPSELFLSSDTTFNKDTIVVNITKKADNLTEFSNSLTKNVIIDNFAHHQNTSDLEPMDITINETLNLTHELPDLVNQTIILAEDNVQNEISSKNTAIEPIQIKLSPNLSDLRNDNNLIPKNLLDIIQCMPNSEANITSVKTISANESITKVIEEKGVNLDLDDNKRPVSEIENTKSVNMNISILSRDDQPPKVFTNTPDLEHVEVEEPTMDEEIIVSPSNSPYVSYMSDVKTLKISENIESDYKESEIESKQLKLEELKKHEEGNNIEKLGNIEDYKENEIERKEAKLEKIEEANNIDALGNIEEPKTIEQPRTIELLEKNKELDKNKEQQESENSLQIEHSCVSKDNVASSPPITSKGYNFNFDEIDDPFATKTKIRLSPPLDTPTKKEAEDNNDKQFKVPNKGVLNRRRSQPLEKKKSTTYKKLNASFDMKITTNKIDSTVVMNVKDKANANQTTEYKPNKENLNEDKKELNQEEDQGDIKTVNAPEHPLLSYDKSKISVGSCDAILSELKSTSSSEQSTYYSAGVSSSESIHSKSVFNLPEIDDVHFNASATKSKIRHLATSDTEIEDPFATRSKMCQSPSPVDEIENPFATRSKMRSSPEVFNISHSKTDTNQNITLDVSTLVQLSKNIEDEDKMDTELMEKDSSINIADSTSSSKATDSQNLTTREVNTEDEDTIEGPFFDAGDPAEKITDIASDDDDMMMFNELRKDPQAQAKEDNLDGELFIDAEAFEFLLNQNKSNIVADSGKESLFLKFDPLFAKRISTDGLFASLNKAQKRQSTPTKPARPSLRNEVSPVSGIATTPTKPAQPFLHNEISPRAGPSTLNVTYECDNNISQGSNEDANITVTKPMMVVNPALNPAVTPRNKSVTPVRSNRRSITFTSPAIAVIDRLLSMSANNSNLGHDSTILSTLSNGEQTEADLALTQLRELLAEKEISVYNLRTESKELKDRLSTMETQVRILEADGQERLKKINELNERLAEKTKINKSMAAVVEEYEKTIASLIADIEQDKKLNAEERIRLINERDEQTAHLTSMEVSFSDLHSKYEKSKQVILTCKANEDVYKKSIQDFQEQVAKMQSNYEMLKQHATAKLNHANQELEKINRAHEAEVVKLNAMIKRNQLLATSLQETLAQKTKANDELTAICDELINKVGSK